MTVEDLIQADRPTFYFVGVTTGKSSIMTVFPKWAEYLGLGKVPIKGIDCKWHDDPEVYQGVVRFLKHDPLSVGALVTTHKLDLLKAAKAEFEYLDPYAELLEEVSCISKKDGKLCGHAKDPFTSGYSYDAFVPKDHWAKTGAEICILGAGGSSLALTAYLMKQKPRAEWPARIIVTNRSPKRLEEMKQVQTKINPGITMEYVLAPTAADNDRVVDGLKPHSLVVNATGLGKDAPGSPLTDQVRFPKNGLVWEYNYRGELIFLQQAQAQQDSQNLQIEDGWVYFIHGWTQVIAEVFHIEIPTSGPGFDELSRIAAAAR